ncbi:MAG: hypothetical protein D6714_10360, partial [Bacteroidetes bacterium]
SQLLGLDFQVFTCFEAFRAFYGPKIIYCNEKAFKGAIQIPVQGLLFENDIRPQNPKVSYFEGLPCFFQVSVPGGDLPFDLFSMVFYLISRYEEYLPGRRDHFGRFPAEESLAHQSGFLQMPLINYWALRLGGMLSKRAGLPAFQPTAKYAFLPTYDIDHAWAFLHKGLTRAIAGTLKDLARLDLNGLKTRFRVYAGREKDPFYTFDFLDQLTQRYDLRPIFFFLLAKWSKYDTNNSLQSPDFRQLIERLSGQFPVGIHPSFRSNVEADYLKTEIQNLEKITRRPVVRSRQHYLILHMPQTYRRLIQQGIREDYSMGFADQTGFRASIAHPFFWFDLPKNQPTPLKIFPFQVMDVTLNHYLKHTPEQALEQVRPLIQHCRQVGGIFCTLWHNSSFTEKPPWENQRHLYTQIIKIAL